MREVHVASRGFLFLSGVLSDWLDFLKLSLTVKSGFLELRVDLVFELLSGALADVGLLFGDLLDLGDVLAEFIAALLSSLTALLLCLRDVSFDLLAEEEIWLVEGLLAVECGLAAFLLHAGGDRTAPVHKDDLALLFCALQLVGDVRLTQLGRGGHSLQTLLDLWDCLVLVAGSASGRHRGSRNVKNLVGDSMGGVLFLLEDLHDWYWWLHLV